MGAETVRLAPRMGFRGDLTYSWSVIAGAPASSTETRRRMSDSPDRVMRPAWVPTDPETSPHVYGSAAIACAVFPNRGKLRT